MFGHRSDGKLLKKIDPIIALTPYLMPMRCDAQVMLKYSVDYEKLARYIVDKGNDGVKLSFMELVIAAYVRAIAEVPQVNRFVSNKRLYARTQLTVSFVVLKTTADPNEIEENTVKCYFDPHDTLFDVADRINDTIENGRHEEADNITMKFAEVLNRPALANLVVGLANFLDRHGILPKLVIDASPFHTTMFITNMASIGMPAVNHHIYNFGTTTMFLSIGAPERTVTQDKDGKNIRKRTLPIGITADERVCAGAMYARFLNRAMYYLNNPALLEQPPEKVLFEEDNEYSRPVPKVKKAKKNKETENA